MALIEKIRKSFWWRVNRLRLRLSHINYGEGCMADGYLYLKIASTAQVKIGDYFNFSSGNGINPICTNVIGCLCVTDRAVLEIGNYTGCSSTVIWANKHIKIGDYVSIGGGTLILDSDQHSLDFQDRRSIVSDQQNRKDAEVVIGNDVLIGARCIILKGVHIGNRVVIGAGSVVTKDIPDDCIAAGNPARILKCNGKNEDNK